MERPAKTSTDLPPGDEAAGEEIRYRACSALPGKGGLAHIAAAAPNSARGLREDLVCLAGLVWLAAILDCLSLVG